MQVSKKSPLAHLAVMIQKIWSYHYAAQQQVAASDFLRVASVPRSLVLIRSQQEVAIVIREGILKSAHAGEMSLDAVCELIEEISHFLHLVWAQENSQTVTKESLEVWAEVDKFLISRWIKGCQSAEDRERNYFELFASSNIAFASKAYGRYSHKASRYLKNKGLVHASPWQCRNILSADLRDANSPVLVA
jgi:hypothetical protein